MKQFTNEVLESLFHAYDIRGQEQDGLGEEFYEQLGMAFVTFLDAQKIILGYDIRPESQIYHQAFIKGATSLGCDVLNIGEIATEMMYYASGKYEEYDGAATVTASHNPAGWNGCKMVRSGAKAISKDSGLVDIKEIMLNQSYRESTGQGSVSELDIYPEYKARILEYFEGVELKPLKLIVDAGNGIGGKLWDYIFDDVPFEVEKMYFEPDGSFPNHVPDPLKEENVAEIREKCLNQDIDLGIAIDGDGDRVFFIDDEGRNPSGVYTGSIIARYLLKTNPGRIIIHDPRVTWPVEKEVIKAGGKPFAIKAGHSFFKESMYKEKGLFGIEMSSHFYYSDMYNADIGMSTIAIVLKMILEGIDFKKELDYFYENYPMSGEVNYQVESVPATLEKVEKEFNDAKISHIDGLSVEYEDWRFNLRGSNTQPLIRLNLEAKDKSTIIEKFKLIEELIGGTRDNVPPMPELR
ncbi:phosphomannomutase/phosphoglucomutase [Candidatus Dojkabacteria bacterium]|uniref:Phosphomannomutase/phosphoglucomutase n=1 Tax=Candidatus Dojkabacteria bacterium TaxID=2099670 RepID=A0A955L4V6_9BACT|nr:phosphomannomutase/phosphoglucomutase [Candidatus Dojkabacteria bacterium]